MVFLEIERAVQTAGGPAVLRGSSQHLLEVIDGLQRLTTLTILFCVMRDLDAARRRQARTSGCWRPSAMGRRRHATRLQLREPDESLPSRHVREPGATLVAVPETDLSRRRKADHRGARPPAPVVQDLDASERQRLVDFLLDGCHVTISITNDIDRAHQMFTVLNARGKPLARNDILKADLLGGVPPAALPAGDGDLA